MIVKPVIIAPKIILEPASRDLIFGDKIQLSWTIHPYVKTKIKKIDGTAEVALDYIDDSFDYKTVAYFNVFKAGTAKFEIEGEYSHLNESTVMPVPVDVEYTIEEAENINFTGINPSTGTLYTKGGSFCVQEYNSIYDGYSGYYIEDLILDNVYPLKVESSDPTLATAYFFTGLKDELSNSIPKPNSANICDTDYNCNDFNFKSLKPINFRGFTYYHGLLIEPKKKGDVSLKIYHESDGKYKNQELTFDIINFKIVRKNFNPIGKEEFDITGIASEIIVDERIKVGNSIGPFPYYNQINEQIKYYEKTIDSSYQIKTTEPLNKNSFLTRIDKPHLNEVYFSGTYTTAYADQLNTTIIGFQDENDEYNPRADIIKTVSIEQLEGNCLFSIITGSFKAPIKLNNFIKNNRYFDNRLFKDTGNLITNINFGFVEEVKFANAGIILSGNSNGEYFLEIPKGRYLPNSGEFYEIYSEIPASKKYKYIKLTSFLSLNKVDISGNFELGSEAKKDPVLSDTYNLKYQNFLPFNFVSDLKYDPVICLGKPFNTITEAYEAKNNGINKIYLENDTASINTISKTIIFKKAGSIDITIYLDGGLAYKDYIKTITINIEKNESVLIFPNIPLKKASDGRFSLNITSNNPDAIIEYSSSNPIIDVNSYGVAKILSFGTAEITATALEDDRFLSSSASRTISIDKGDQIINFQLQSRSIASDQLPIKLTATTNNPLNPITFSSSNKDIVSIVDENYLQINNVGNAIIFASQGATRNYNAAQTISQPISIKYKTELNIPYIPFKNINSAPFNLNVTSNNLNPIKYKSTNEFVATINNLGLITIKNPGATEFIITQDESLTHLSAEEVKVFRVSTESDNLETFLQNTYKYIDYRPKKYKKSSNDVFYNAKLPQINEEHILLLDLNLYGFEEDSIENCDIELNAQILRTGYFYSMPKQPIPMNLAVEDLTPPINAILGLDDLFKEKSIIKNLNVHNKIYYNNYFENNIEFLPNYRFIRTEFEVAKPIASLSEPLGIPVLFEYQKNPSYNKNYDIKSYSLVLSGIASEESLNNQQMDENGNIIVENFYKKADYISGEITGFVSLLKPGKYAAILSGNQKDFLDSRNQDFGSLVINLEYLSGEKFQKIYIDNQDVIWATYNLSYAELIPGSGYEKLSSDDPKAFSIDFSKGISGVLNFDAPSLSYQEYSGDYVNLCATDMIKATLSDPFCTLKLKFICILAEAYRKSGISQMDVPRTALPKSKYETANVSAGQTMTATNLANNLDNADAATQSITYLADPNDKNFYTIAINDNLFSTCCFCQQQASLGEIKWEDPELVIQSQLYSGITYQESGDAIYSNIFFLDDLSASAVGLKYNYSYYSGEIKLKEDSLLEGDKVIFEQYPYDFEFVYLNLYGVGVPPAYKPLKKEFIFSKTLLGDQYWSDVNELTSKINENLALKNYYSWKPMKYAKEIEFLYGPLLTGKNLGINSSGEHTIGLAALQSGKMGSFNIKLELTNRNVVYPYLLPKVIKMQVSDDGEVWTDVVGSDNRLPINTYIKNPDAEIKDIFNIKYDKISSTDVTQKRTVKIGSDIESIPNPEPENLGELISGIASRSPLSTGNYKKDPTKENVYCIPNRTGFGLKCGSGFVDFIFETKSLSGSGNAFIFCSTPKESCSPWPGAPQTTADGTYGENLSLYYNEDAKAAPFYGFSGDCCTGKYDPSFRPTGWCCSGVWSPINPSGCKTTTQQQTQKEENTTSETLTIEQQISTYRLAFYDYLNNN